MDILTGILLIASACYSMYRIYVRKLNKQLVFKHQIFLFEWIFGKKNATNALVIFVSIIEIIFGLAFLFGKLSW